MGSRRYKEGIHGLVMHMWVRVLIAACDSTLVIDTHVVMNYLCYCAMNYLCYCPEHPPQPNLLGRAYHNYSPTDKTIKFLIR